MHYLITPWVDALCRSHALACPEQHEASTADSQASAAVGALHLYRITGGRAAGDVWALGTLELHATLRPEPCALS